MEYKTKCTPNKLSPVTYPNTTFPPNKYAKIKINEKHPTKLIMILIIGFEAILVKI